uniref:Bestrophin homolog n=1 Tax=Parascaris univalens TaxID=6257 RepID=A0A915CL59_PARUN
MRLPGGKRNRQFDAAFVCLGVVVVLWKIGLLDHLLEKPFSEFRWPPYVDVRLEVALELNVPCCNSFDVGCCEKAIRVLLRTIFVVGDLQREHKNKMGDVLAREADQYGDLLIGDYIDAYRNNTLKFLSAVQLSFSYCSTEENTVHSHC